MTATSTPLSDARLPMIDPKMLDAAIRSDLWAPDMHAIVDAVNATSDAGDLSTEQCIALGVLLAREALAARSVPEGWEWPDLNVTTEELIRIKNTCVGKDGDVKIWSKMLWIMIEYILAVRAFEKEVRSSPKTKTVYIRAGEHGRDGQNVEVPVASPALASPQHAGTAEGVALAPTRDQLIIDLSEWFNRLPVGDSLGKSEYDAMIGIVTKALDHPWTALATHPVAVAAKLDADLGAGMGDRIIAAAKAMGEAVDGPDSYAQASASRRGHWNWLAQLALGAADPLYRASSIQADEIGWLIELKAARPTWWSIEGEGGFTHDSLKALRFARKKDADDYIADTGWTEAFASEHIWSDPPVSLAGRTK